VTWGLLWAILTNPGRFLKALFPRVDHGIAPLELSAACIDRVLLTSDERNAVRELRIPDACVPSLSGRAMGRAGGAFAICVNCAVVMYMAWVSRAEFFAPGPERWLYLALTIAVLLATVTATVIWCLGPRRDVRERGLREEQGELTSKWSKAREHEDGSKSVIFRARIGRRTHAIVSSYLFGALGGGVLYRLYLSKHSGQLIAIESIEAIGGVADYRTGVGHRRARAIVPVPSRK
jgi:hypothetical protein